MNEPKNIVQENEIDLVERVKTIWSKRLFVVKVSGAFFLLGLIIAFTSKVEYVASCKLLPENQEGGSDLGGLGGLAGFAGFDLSGIKASGSLSPELYPEIVNSVLFLNKLIHEPIYFEDKDTTVSSFNYFKEIDGPSLSDFITGYTLGLPGKIKAFFFKKSNEPFLKSYGLIRFSKEDWNIIERYKDRLFISVDSQTGTIGISSEMPDPVAAAMVTDLLVQELTRSVTNYKIEKSQTNLAFIQERFGEAKAKYESKQEQLAKFTNNNRYISSFYTKTEYERLQNELNITFEVYKGLASQLEQAKIKVKEETPVFTVLEPVRVPEDKSKPNRKLILIVFTFLGGLISIIYVLVKNYLNVG